MVTQRGATSGERAQQVHGGGPKATHSILVPQWCEPGVLRLLVIAEGRAAVRPTTGARHLFETFHDDEQK